MNLVKRSEIVAFLNTVPSTTGTYTWSLIGVGMPSLSYAYNPSATTETWIINDNATTTLDSYAFSLEGEQQCYKGDPVFDYIDELRKTMAVGTSAMSQLLLVDKYDYTGTTPNVTYKAQLFNCTLQVNDFGGDGGATPTISYTVSANGDATLGTVAIADGVPTFTAKETV